MKVTLEFFKDMGACEGSLAAITHWFEMNGITEGDYGELSVAFKADANREYLETFIDEYDEDGHNTIQGWYDWADELPTRLEAITYFNDHTIEEYHCIDGKVFDNEADAREYTDSLTHAELQNLNTFIQTGSITTDDEGNETIRSFHPDNLDHNADEDEYFLYDPDTNMQNRTSSPTMVALGVAQIKDTQKRLLGIAPVTAKIVDESGKYVYWKAV